MDRSTITEKLRTIIEPYAENKEAFAAISEETDLLKDLEINSANLVDIILDVEEEFDIEIDDDAAEQMMTVKASIEVIEKLLA